RDQRETRGQPQQQPFGGARHLLASLGAQAPAQVVFVLLRFPIAPEDQVHGGAESTARLLPYCYSISGETTASMRAGASPESHQIAPFLIDQSVRAPATSWAAAWPRSGWWPTMMTRPSCRCAALMIAAAEAPGASAFSVITLSPRAAAVSCARAAGLAR